MPIIISSITRVASTNRIKNQLVSNENENIHLLTNWSFLLNAKTAFRDAPASAASSCPTVWFDHLIVQQNRNCIENECYSQILLPDSSPSGMDATTLLFNGQPNHHNINGGTNNNYYICNKMVSNAHRKNIISVSSVDNDDEFNGNDVSAVMTLPKESRIKFRITENPMNNEMQ